MLREKIRIFLWNILGISKSHISFVADKHYLKEDRYSSVGKHSYDNNAVVYRWSDAPLVIGKYCGISYDVRFILDDGGHMANNVSSYPFKTNGISRKQGITVGNDVWIGAGVTILPGVIIGNGVTIAAGAIVTKNVDDYCVVGGVPATVKKRKCSEDDAKMMNQISWWDWPEDKIQNEVSLFSGSISEFIKLHT